MAAARYAASADGTRPHAEVRRRAEGGCSAAFAAVFQPTLDGSYPLKLSWCTALQVEGAQPSGKESTAFANTAVEISAAAPPFSLDA